jgi:glucosamine 6-phosphate synthetase-like amidotransferase/phosphosugar isomerase protein
MKASHNLFFIISFSYLLDMCQLAAYVGERPLAKTLLDSLRAQEGYLGAHTAGIAALNSDRIDLVKDCGPVDEVIKNTDIDKLSGTAGIAHSRYNVWAPKSQRYNTPGASHPWIDDAGKIALMHNGEIKNSREHFDRLRTNHVFQSYIEEFDYITDSEVAVHLIGDEISNGASVEEALRIVTPRLTGQFLLGTVHVDHPDTVWIANWIQPCYVAIGEEEAMFSSAKIGLKHVKSEMTSIFQPPKNSIIKLTRGHVEITCMDPSRMVPDLTLDANEMGRQIMRILGETGELDPVRLYLTLVEHGFNEAYHVSLEKWNDIRGAGFGEANHILETIYMLESDGMVNVRVDVRDEWGLKNVPRLLFSLA